MNIGKPVRVIEIETPAIPVTMPDEPPTETVPERVPATP